MSRVVLIILLLSNAYASELLLRDSEESIQCESTQTPDTDTADLAIQTLAPKLSNRRVQALPEMHNEYSQTKRLKSYDTQSQTYIDAIDKSSLTEQVNTLNGIAQTDSCETAERHMQTFNSVIKHKGTQYKVQRHEIPPPETTSANVIPQEATQTCSNEKTEEEQTITDKPQHNPIPNDTLQLHYC